MYDTLDGTVIHCRESPLQVTGGDSSKERWISGSHSAVERNGCVGDPPAGWQYRALAPILLCIDARSHRADSGRPFVSHSSQTGRVAEGKDILLMRARQHKMKIKDAERTA